MGMVVRSNINSMNANRNLSKNNSQAAKAIEKLASGYAINRAADDASGLAISEKMKAQISGLGQAEKNIVDGISVTNVADGALNEVSDMLIRIEELSIQAANGTYSDVERDMIKAEIQVLYDEMDRIFQSSNFNGIKLFDHDTTIIDTGLGDLDVDDVVEYFVSDENIVGPIEPTFLEGSIMFDMVDATNFDLAEYTGATATLTIDNYYLNDYTLMEGASFKIGSTTYTIPSSYITGSNSVQDVFDRLASSISSVTSIKLDGNDVTFTFGAGTSTQTLLIDGVPAQYNYLNGEYYNGTVVSSNTVSGLGTIDSINNSVVGENEIWITNKSIVSGSGDIPESVSKELEYTTITIFGKTLVIGDEIKSNNINTYEELQEYINKQILDEYKDIKDSYPDAGVSITENDDGSFDIYIEDYTKLPSSTYYTISTGVTDDAPYTPAIPAGYVSDASMPDPDYDTIESTAESSQVTTITLPDSYDMPSGVITINVNGITKTFYTADCEYADYLKDNWATLVTDDNAIDTINDWITDQLQYTSGILDNTDTYKGYEVNDDGTITLTGPGNTSFGVSISVASTKVSDYVAQDKAYPSSSIKTLTNLNYSRDYSIEVDILNTLGDPFDLSNLANTGFKINGKYFEFSDGSVGFEQSYSSATLIDISSATDANSLIALINSAFSSTATATLNDETGKINFTFTASHSTSSLSSYFIDGYSSTTGLFSEVGTSGTDSTVSATASGGTPQNQAQSTIDFSGYDESNITDLYGQGFRITCATCPGEYINILFSYNETLDEDFNPFQVEVDEDGHAEDIYTYVIPLEGVTSGSEVVSLIIEQLNSNVLTHTTEFAVGDPDSTLVVLDRRLGDMYIDGELSQAQVLAGVVTNFDYNITLDEVTDNSPDSSSSSTTNNGSVYAYDVDIHGIDIFTFSPDNYDAYITIRLPHLTVDLFSFVPPNPILDTNDECMNQVNLAKCAALTISRCRSWIGADRNRLEATLNNTMNSNEQITSANSTIKDTDMAKEMMEYTKMDILTQASQSMLVQSNQSLQQILSLLG